MQFVQDRLPLEHTHPEEEPEEDEDDEDEVRPEEPPEEELEEDEEPEELPEEPLDEDDDDKQGGLGVHIKLASQQIKSVPLQPYAPVQLTVAPCGQMMIPS